MQGHDVLSRRNLLQVFLKSRDIARSASFLHRKEAFLACKREIPFLPKVCLLLSCFPVNLCTPYFRYKLRGIRNLVFYGLPDHAQFYTEFLSFPFLDEGVDASDVSCRALYCKYDWMRLERIAGTEGAIELIQQV